MCPSLTADLQKIDKARKTVLVVDRVLSRLNMRPWKKVLSRIPNTEGLYILSDFNARVGANNEAWPTFLGPRGRGKINFQHLLKYASPVAYG